MKKILDTSIRILMTIQMKKLSTIIIVIMANQ